MRAPFSMDLAAVRRLGALCVAGAAAFAVPTDAEACSTNTGCRVQPVYGRSPCDAEVPGLIAPVCRNDFGSEGPTIPQIKKGAAGTTKVTGSMPCLLFTSLTFVESSWHMFCADACGSQGLTMIGGGCGYGYSQITSGMRASDLANNTSTGFDVNRVASSATYNLATGLQFMVGKWNARKPVGDRDPEVVEHWYYAVWAYNSFSWKNNPNNPKYPEGRTPWYCPGTSSRSSYPYQEAVWGYMRCPPSRGGAKLWTGYDISYPDTSGICTSEGCAPAALPNPLPNHKDPCQKGQSGPVYDPDAVKDSDGDGAADSQDCAPNDPSIHPGAVESCNGRDDDCDGKVDDGATCPDGQECSAGACVAVFVDAGPVPETPDTGHGEDDSGLPGGADGGGGGVPLACTSHDQCPDGFVCDDGACAQDPVPVDPDPPVPGDADAGGTPFLPDAGPAADAGSGESPLDDIRVSSSGCDSSTGFSDPGLLAALLAAFAPLLRKRRSNG